MRNLNESLSESLLDKTTAFDDLDDVYYENWITKYVKTGTIKRFKNGTCRFNGDVLIKDLNDDKFIELNVTEVNGTVTIQNCPNIKNLGEWFINCRNFKGGLNITNCDSLESFVGCPEYVEGPMSIVNNKNLRSLEGFPKLVFGNIYIMKNGKRFKEDEIKSKLRDFDRKIYV